MKALGAFEIIYYATVSSTATLKALVDKCPTVSKKLIDI
jgi:hypothetical protein